MPRQLLIIVTCDVCGSDTNKGEKSKRLPMTVGRRSVELDLCDSCEQTLAEAVTPFLEAARPGHAALAPAQKNGEQGERRPMTPHECDRCHYWFRGAGLNSHRSKCTGDPPPFPCPENGCLTGFTQDNNLRDHIASGIHIIPTAAEKKAEKARLRELAASA